MERYRHRATGTVVTVDDGVGAALGDGFERVDDVKADEAPVKEPVRRTRTRKTDS